MKFVPYNPVILPAQPDAPRNATAPTGHDASPDQPALQLAVHADSPPVAAVPQVLKVPAIGTIGPRRILTRRTMH